MQVYNFRIRQDAYKCWHVERQRTYTTWFGLGPNKIVWVDIPDCESRSKLWMLQNLKEWLERDHRRKNPVYIYFDSTKLDEMIAAEELIMKGEEDGKVDTGTTS